MDPMSYQALINYLEAKHISLALQVVVSGFKGLFENSEDNPVKFAESFHQILRDLDEYDEIIRENEPFLSHSSARSNSTAKQTSQERMDSLERFLQEYYPDGSRVEYIPPEIPVKQMRQKTPKSNSSRKTSTDHSILPAHSVRTDYNSFNPNFDSTNHSLKFIRPSQRYQVFKDDGNFTKMANLSEEDPSRCTRQRLCTPTVGRPKAPAQRPRSDSFYQNPFFKRHM